MSYRPFRVTAVVLLLALLPSGAAAQRNRKMQEPPRVDSNSCHAPGIRCFFGRAQGCRADCTNGMAVCIGARCVLGFPIAAECSCQTSGVS